MGFYGEVQAIELAHLNFKHSSFILPRTPEPFCRAHPLTLLGLQDITAHVDFTAVAQAAVAADLEVAGYTTQANFLLDTGLLEKLNSCSPDDPHFYRLSQQAKLLTLPSEMGELFKVMALTANLDIALLGFRRDERWRL